MDRLNVLDIHSILVLCILLTPTLSTIHAITNIQPVVLITNLVVNDLFKELR